VARRGGDFLDSYRVEWESLLDAIGNGSAVPCSFEDGYQAVVATHAAARSAELGTVVSTSEPLEADPA
jgi:predicted dehydrogenase